MSYTTPVYDRTQSDIAAQNSKAFLNYTDWIRIYDNAEWVNGLFTSEIGYSLQFDELTDPTTASIPAKTFLNTLLENIERMRYWSNAYLSDYINDPLFVEIKDDWDEGHAVASPNFTHVNSWEKVIDIMFNVLNTWTPPVISGNLELLGSAGDFELIAGGGLELIG